MIRAVLSCAICLTLALTTSVSIAQEAGPDVLLKTVVAEVQTITKQNRGHLNAAKTNQLSELLERKILPLFDFGRMTQTAVARHWVMATSEQRNALTAEFRTLLVRTYSTALRNYRDEKIEFKPLDLMTGATEATVKSVLRQGGAERATIDYDMEKTLAGWKVYEIRLDGVNLIANYRETFVAKIRTSGVDGLIRALAEKNRQNSSGSGTSTAGGAPENPT